MALDESQLLASLTQAVLKETTNIIITVTVLQNLSSTSKESKASSRPMQNPAQPTPAARVLCQTEPN